MQAFRFTLHFSSYNSIPLNGPIAQLVEQLTLNQRVAGSSPARLTITRKKDLAFSTSFQNLDFD